MMSEQVARSLAAWLDESSSGEAGDMMVYECERPGYDSNRLRDLATAHGLAGPVLEDEGVCMVQDGRRALCMYRASGAHWYVDGAKLRHRQYAPSLPDDAVAIRVAADYLRPGPGMIAGATPSVTRGVISYFGRGTTRAEESDNNLDVTYRSGLGGIPLFGPGAKTRVNVGHGGEILGASHVPQTFRPLRRYPIRTRAEVAHILERKHGVSRERLRVRRSTLACWVESPVLVGRYVQPVYLLQLEVEGLHGRPVRFRPPPIPATRFAPVVLIDDPRRRIEIPEGEPLVFSCEVTGGTPPYTYRWESHLTGWLGDGARLEVPTPQPAWREDKLLAHEVTVTVTDAHGMRDRHSIAVTVVRREPRIKETLASGKPPADESKYCCGVEWCNDYSNTILPSLVGTDESALGFNQHVGKLPDWSSRFAWGNDAAWEQDFKDASAPGGGTDKRWADNVEIAFFAGHGAEFGMAFNSTVDDRELTATDARWGDKRLRWIVLHACECLWEDWHHKWYDAFCGLHTIFGFNTNTGWSDPPLGARFAYWASHSFLSPHVALDLQTAWAIACGECYDTGVQYAVLSACQNGISMRNDHLPGFGPVVSPDPTAPDAWEYYPANC